MKKSQYSLSVERKAEDLSKSQIWLFGQGDLTYKKRDTMMALWLIAECISAYLLIGLRVGIYAAIPVVALKLFVLICFNPKVKTIAIWKLTLVGLASGVIVPIIARLFENIFY